MGRGSSKVGGNSGSSGSTGSAQRDIEHKAAISKLENNGNTVEEWQAVRIPDVNYSTDSHLLVALVKSSNGNYSIRTSSFNAISARTVGNTTFPADSYKQRSNFTIRRSLQGYSGSSAKLEYEDYINSI